MGILGDVSGLPEGVVRVTIRVRWGTKGMLRKAVNGFYNVSAVSYFFPDLGLPIGPKVVPFWDSLIEFQILLWGLWVEFLQDFVGMKLGPRRAPNRVSTKRQKLKPETPKI